MTRALTIIAAVLAIATPAAANEEHQTYWIEAVQECGVGIHWWAHLPAGTEVTVTGTSGVAATFTVDDHPDEGIIPINPTGAVYFETGLTQRTQSAVTGEMSQPIPIGVGVLDSDPCDDGLPATLGVPNDVLQVQSSGRSDRTGNPIRPVLGLSDAVTAAVEDGRIQ